MTKYVGGSGSLGAQLMILSEAPRHEDTTHLFTGKDKRALDDMLRSVGISRSEIWTTSVFKQPIQENTYGRKIPGRVRAKNSGVNVEQALEELQVEINEIKPNCILGLGVTALWALTGKENLENYRGSILQGMGRKCVNTFNPYHLIPGPESELVGYWHKPVIEFDFKRALKQSRFAEFDLPKRNLEICRSSAQLASFYERYRHIPNVSVDIEANGLCIPVCVGIAFNRNHGMVIPLWNHDGISSIPDSDMVSIWIILSQLLSNHGIIGQNFNYDQDKLQRIGFKIKCRVSDTMLKAFAINPELPKRLAFNQSIYTEEPFYKDEGMYHGSIEDLLIGCARDACVTWEINEEMDPDLDELEMREYYENFLMQLPELYLGIEQLGFAQDTEERDRLLESYIKKDEENRYELYKLVGYELNVASPKQVAQLLFEELQLPMRDGTGEEQITSLLNLKSMTDKKVREILERILTGRRLRKTISNSIMVLPDYDGRIRTTYFPCLETGRTSTGQQDIPIRPEIELIDENGKKKKKSLGTPFQTITKHGDIGADVRKMYLP